MLSSFGNANLSRERCRLFFPIDTDDWSKALGQLRRLRHRGNLGRIAASDSYWSSASVETVDSLLLEKAELAFALSTQIVVVAERLRVESCPNSSETGKRSLIAWTRAVHGSACRVTERYREAEAAFKEAFRVAGKGILPWAAAEVSRRFAALLLNRGSLQGLAHIERAIECYEGFPAGKADALVLRGLLRQKLQKDLAGAAQDFGAALKLLEPKRSDREARTWLIALHDLCVVYANGAHDLATLENNLKQVRQAAAALTRHEAFRRNLCSWVEALLLVPLGSGRQAERLLNRARNWFFRKRYFLRGTLCSIDLALVLQREGERNKAKAVLTEMLAAISSAPNDTRSLIHERLSGLLGSELQEEGLATLREASAHFALLESTAAQPLGTIEGPSSSPSPS